MTVRVGRNYLRAAFSKGSHLEIVAVNDLTHNRALAHVLKYDSVTGRLAADLILEGDSIVVGGKPIKVLKQRDAAALGWGDPGTDIAIGATVHLVRQRGEPVAIPQESIDSLFARYQNVYGHASDAPSTAGRPAEGALQ